MSDTPNKPLTSVTSNDKDGLFAALAAAFRFNELRTDQMLPAQVVKFDRAKNLVTIKPLIMWVSVDDSKIPRNTLVDMNALSIGAGGFHISFPIAPGDLGWIWAADRDLSLFKQKLAEVPPTTGRCHKFDDCMFIPDVFRNYTINEEDAGYMVIQSVDSATRISIRPDNIKITAPSKVTIDVPTTEITGDVIIDKTLTVQQLVTANAGLTAPAGTSVTLPVATTVNGINVTNHGHEQNGDSGRTSGGMEA